MRQSPPAPLARRQILFRIRLSAFEKENARSGSIAAAYLALICRTLVNELIVEKVAVSSGT